VSGSRRRPPRGGGSWSSSSTTSRTGIARYVGPLTKQSPHAIREIKELLRETRDERSDEREVQAFAACLNSADGQEGVAAFLEKRAPNWSGT
jgi:Enoyl-CoA hydratase/carnithine racemase